MTQTSGTILLVEDNEDDVFFMRRALKAAEITLPLHVASNGQMAVDYLAGAGDYADRTRYPLPCVVLLDLKLPIKGGLEVLGWLRENPDLYGLVVLVLTTSREPNDVHTAYRLGAKSYIVKPNDVTVLIDILRAMKHFWLTYNEFAMPG